MANNKVNNQNRSLIDQQRNSSTSQYQSYLNNTGAQVGNATNADNQLRGQIQQGYTNSNNFLPSGMLPNSSGFFNLPTGSPTASTAGADFGSSQSGYQKMADTGGASNYADAQKTYSQLAANGGIGDPNAIIASETSIVPSFYENMKNQMANRNTTQGGYSPGYDAQTAQMARDASKQSYQANIDAQANLQGLIQQGKESGAAGLAGIGSQISGNQLAGLGGLYNISNANLGASEFNAGQQNAMKTNNFNQNLAFQQNMADLYQRGGLASQQGLQDLYSSTPGNTSMYNQLYLSGLGGMNNSQLSNLGLRNQVPNNSWLNYLPGMVGAGGSLLSGLGDAGFSFG